MKTATIGMTAALLVGLWAGTAPAAGFVGVLLRKADVGKGVVIREVADDSPAAKARLKPDDRIDLIDGKEFDGLQGWVETVQAHKPGDMITLTIYRDDKKLEIKVTVGEVRGP
jgi:serine protease Do